MGCITPYYVNHKTQGWLPLPCGRCPPCKRRRINSWVFRLLEEDKVSTAADFVTLTHTTLDVPITPNGFMTLDKSVFQKFMKRLRQHTWEYYNKLTQDKKRARHIYKSNPIRYYAVGEYGEQRSRPHYHAIIFNIPDPILYRDAWTVDSVQKGKIDVGSVTGDSIAYCAKYIDKHKTIPLHKRDDRIPEFSLMSKGLGKSYAENAETILYHKTHPNELYLTKPGGYKIAMPKYYRDKLFTEQEQSFQTKYINQKMEEMDRDFQEIAKKKNVDYDTYREMHIKNIIQRFNNNIKKRKL